MDQATSALNFFFFFSKCACVRARNAAPVPVTYRMIGGENICRTVPELSKTLVRCSDSKRLWGGRGGEAAQRSASNCVCTRTFDMNFRCVQ